MQTQSRRTSSISRAFWEDVGSIIFIQFILPQDLANFASYFQLPGAAAPAAPAAPVAPPAASSRAVASKVGSHGSIKGMEGRNIEKRS